MKKNGEKNEKKKWKKDRKYGVILSKCEKNWRKESMGKWGEMGNSRNVYKSGERYIEKDGVGEYRNDNWK